MRRTKCERYILLGIYGRAAETILHLEPVVPNQLSIVDVLPCILNVPFLLKRKRFDILINLQIISTNLSN